MNWPHRDWQSVTASTLMDSLSKNPMRVRNCRDRKNPLDADLMKEIEKMNESAPNRIPILSTERW
jgi:hypothetical protein